tara:strand:- start:1654 stop:1800 length:147 start_codon:yes stop_codon:yes gene_type:complete
MLLTTTLFTHMMLNGFAFLFGLAVPLTVSIAVNLIVLIINYMQKRSAS